VLLLCLICNCFHLLVFLCCDKLLILVQTCSINTFRYVEWNMQEHCIYLKNSVCFRIITFLNVIFLHKSCVKSFFSPSVWTWRWQYWKRSTMCLIFLDLIRSSFGRCGDDGQSLMNLFLSHWDRKSIQFSISHLCVITISANVLSTVFSCRSVIWQSVYISWKLYTTRR